MMIFNSKKRLVNPAFFCASIVFILFAMGVVAGCDRQSTRSLIAFSGPTMGTVYNVKIVDEKRKLSAEDIQSVVDAELLRINMLMSTYIADSELSRFNQVGVTDAFTVSSELCHLLALNQAISDATSGRYDATIGPLVNLWGFGPDDIRAIPSAIELEEAKSKVGYTYVSFDCDKATLSKSKPVYVDLSASAKGFGADSVVAILKDLGFDDVMVEIGGELRVSGVNASSKPWQIAVEKPSLGREGGLQVLQVSDVGVATSGDYRNYYEVDGKRVSHTIDPVTAHPITHNLASVTVVAGSCAEADAWATALNVLGPDEGFSKAIEQRLAAYFIVRDGERFSVNYTDEFKQYMVNL